MSKLKIYVTRTRYQKDTRTNKANSYTEYKAYLDDILIKKSTSYNTNLTKFKKKVAELVNEKHGSLKPEIIKDSVNLGFKPQSL